MDDLLFCGGAPHAVLFDCRHRLTRQICRTVGHSRSIRRFGRQHVDRALFDAAMRLLNTAIPCAQGKNRLVKAVSMSCRGVF